MSSCVGEKPVTVCATRDHAIESIQEEFYNFFSRINPSASKPINKESAEKMTQFTIILYQHYFYNFNRMLQDPNLNPDDKEAMIKRDIMVEQMKYIINNFIKPNLDIIYSTIIPENETINIPAKKDSTSTSVIPISSIEEKQKVEEIVDLPTQIRIKYAVMLKGIVDKMNGGPDEAAEIICDVMRDYKANGFDKVKTLSDKVDFLPDDMKNQLKPMYEKLLTDVDEYIYLHTPPPKQQINNNMFEQIMRLNTEQKSNESHLTDTEKATNIYTRLVQHFMLLFKGDKDMALDFVNWVMQTYEQEDRSKFSTIKKVKEMMNKYEIPSEFQKTLEERSGMLIEFIDRYLVLTKSIRKDINHDMYSKNDGYISDDEPIDTLPKIHNDNFFHDYFTGVMLCYPTDTTRMTVGKLIKDCSSGTTVQPTHPEFQEELSIFQRRMMKMSKKGGGYYQNYEPPDSPRTRVIKGFQVAIDRLQINAGVTTHDPINKVRAINRKLANINNEYMPVVMSLSELANNITEIHGLMWDVANKLLKYVPEKYQVAMPHNILTSQQEFQEILKVMQSIELWINRIEFSKEPEPDDKIFPLLRYAHQVMAIYHTFEEGYIIRKHPKSKKYIFIMQPYNYCYGCRMFKIETDLTHKNGFFTPVICSKCKSEIYHLNKSLFFKWNAKEKLPYLALSTNTTSEEVTHGPKPDDFANLDVLDFDTFKDALIDKFDEDTKYTIPNDLKLTDLNITPTIPDKFIPVITPTHPPIPVAPSHTQEDTYSTDMWH